MIYASKSSRMSSRLIKIDDEGGDNYDDGDNYYDGDICIMMHAVFVCNEK